MRKSGSVSSLNGKIADVLGRISDDDGCANVLSGHNGVSGDLELSGDIDVGEKDLQTPENQLKASGSWKIPTNMRDDELLYTFSGASDHKPTNYT